MIGETPASVVIGAQILKGYAVGDTPAARFAAIIKPDNLSQGCWMTTDEEQQFKCAVGGLLLSYETGSAEQERIATEILQVGRVSAMLQAAVAGLGISDVPETPAGFQPIGLLKLWREREK